MASISSAASAASPRRSNTVMAAAGASKMNESQLPPWGSVDNEPVSDLLRKYPDWTYSSSTDNQLLIQCDEDLKLVQSEFDLINTRAKTIFECTRISPSTIKVKRSCIQPVVSDQVFIPESRLSSTQSCTQSFSYEFLDRPQKIDYSSLLGYSTYIRFDSREAAPLEEFFKLLSKHGDVEHQSADKTLFLPSDGGGILIEFINFSDHFSLRFNFNYLGSDPEKMKRKLLTIIQGADLKTKLFTPSRYYDEECRANVKRNTSLSVTPSLTGPISSLPSASIVLLPDWHGDLDKYRTLVKLIKDPSIKWLGLEMIPHTMQGIVDDFLNRNSQEALGALKTHFINNWSSKFDSHEGSLSGDYYVDLLLLAKDYKKLIYCLDSSMDYYKNRDSLSLAFYTRNYIWAASVPVTDNVGVLFGGATHFYRDSNKLKGSLQVFLKDRFPDRPLFIINK